MGREFKNFDLEVKASGEGTFTGYASTFGNKDSHGDVCVKGCFQKSIQKGGRNGNGVAMLLHHDPRRPIGIWTMLVEDDRGLKVEGKLVTSTKDGFDTYELLKAGALKGLSIGYDAIIKEYDSVAKTRYLKEVELWEISPVTFGANAQAGVTSVKGIDNWENQIPVKEVTPISDGAKYEYSKCVLQKYFGSPNEMDAYKQCFQNLEDTKNEIIENYNELKNGLEELTQKAQNLYQLDPDNFQHFFDISDDINWRLKKCEATLKKEVDFSVVSDRLATFENMFRKSYQSKKNSTTLYDDKDVIPEKKKKHKTVYEKLGFFPGSEQAERILLGID